jgi:N4-gp56 family major capsid protein
VPFGAKKDFFKMADTAAATGLVVQQWEDKFFQQYLHDGGFKALMGTDENAVIQVKEDLTKKAGDSITIALINRLDNAAVTGSSTLEGNEEDMTQRSMRIFVDKRRNGVRIAEMAEQRTAISLRNAARATLLDWAMEDTRDLAIEALGSLNGTRFVDRTAAIADAWLVDNADRVIFGAAAAGFTDMSADLALLDTTADLFNATALDAMVLKAKTCNPKIRPMRDPGNGKRYYVAFANPHAFKNLRDSLDTEVLASTVVQMEASKLFEGGDIFWNGVIVKETDNIPIYENLGTSATNEVTPVYLCGAQALAVAYAKRWRTVTETFDYEDKDGVAIEAIYGVRKIIFGTGSGDTDDLKDHGVVTGYFATTGTATIAAAVAAEN